MKKVWLAGMVLACVMFIAVGTARAEVDTGALQDLINKLRLQIAGLGGVRPISPSPGNNCQPGATMPSGLPGQTIRCNENNIWEANYNITNNGTNVGIGTNIPTAKLEVAGQVRITGGSPAAGKVLTSDATGLGSWQTPTGGGDGNGTVTQLNEGEGITLTPNVITTTGTIGVDFNQAQKRVFGVCPDGQAVKSVNADGNVVCASAGGGTLPPGTSGQTLRHNGTSWVANNIIYNDGSRVGIGATNLNNEADQTLLVRDVSSNTDGGTAIYGISNKENGVGTMGFGRYGLYGYGSDIIPNSVGVMGSSAGTTGIGVEGNAFTGVSGITDSLGGVGVKGMVPPGINGTAVYASHAGNASGYGFYQATTNPLVKNYFRSALGIGQDPDPAVGQGLDLAGQIKIRGGNPGAGKILTSDATGLASWSLPAASVDGVQGSGTANYLPRWTGNKVLGDSPIFVSPTGEVGIGTNVPKMSRLTVKGDGFDQAISGFGGNAADGVVGSSIAANGVMGDSNSGSGVHGSSQTGAGVSGYSQSMTGVSGVSTSGTGVHGESQTGTGIYGSSLNGNKGESGVFGFGGGQASGVYGSNSSSGVGVQGGSDQGTGVYGSSGQGTGEKSVGVWGESYSPVASGVRGVSHSVTGIGVEASNVAGGWGFFSTAPKNYFAGNTGIGTQTPTEKLHVAGAGATRVIVQDTNGGGTAQVIASGADAYFGSNGLATSKLYLRSGNATPQVMIDGNGNTTFLRLTGSGNAYACLNAAGQLYRSNTPCI